MQITKLDDHRPHIVVWEGETPHCLPVATIEDAIEGRKELAPEIMRIILREWLAIIQARGFSD